MEYVESFKQNKKWSTLSWHCPFMYVCTSMFIIFNWSETHLYGLHVLVQYSMYSLTPSSSGDRSQLSPLGGGPWFSPKYHAQSEIELPRIHAHSLHLYHQTYSIVHCILVYSHATLVYILLTALLWDQFPPKPRKDSEMKSQSGVLFIFNQFKGKDLMIERKFS